MPLVLFYEKILTNKAGELTGGRLTAHNSPTSLFMAFTKHITLFLSFILYYYLISLEGARKETYLLGIFNSSCYQIYTAAATTKHCFIYVII